MGLLIVTSYLIAELSQVSLPSQLLSEQKVLQHTLLLTSNPYVIPSETHQQTDLPLEEIIEHQCRGVPTGVGIPAFQPGIVKKDVLRMLGVPTGTSRGYWPNTGAVYYALIPDQVSLGFLFDKHSQRIRQTEASFTVGVDSRIVLLTLNGMLGCQLNEQIEQGLHQVRQGESRQYFFSLNSLKGVIERQKSDRLYIGIWEADLH
ncbi:MAG TPA: hypothetical protein V6D14_00590 [Coleofasciculaceae cyanobacterium]|jgi:hypothetical protein